jgi:hypothetical protein
MQPARPHWRQNEDAVCRDELTVAVLCIDAVAAGALTHLGDTRILFFRAATSSS